MAPMVTVDSIHDPKTGTWQYIVADPNTLDAVIIDPVMDFDRATQTISTDTADRLTSLVRRKGYRILRILETHVHADHVTAAAYLQSVLERDQGFTPPICIGSRIRDIQQLFGPRYGVPAAELSSAFDVLLKDDEIFLIGDLQAKVIHLPGHTPDHIGYIIGGNYPSLIICPSGLADDALKKTYSVVTRSSMPTLVPHAVTFPVAALKHSISPLENYSACRVILRSGLDMIIPRLNDNALFRI